MKYLPVALLFATLLPTAHADEGQGGAQNKNRTKNPSDPYAKHFEYPADMPRPPEMWVEGFASRLHAQNIQKYETPIQVWQTWRLDQTMWNCIAHYHPTALNAITKADPMPRVPETYHTSEARALCMIHAINKLIPDLVPISADAISGWLDDLGLDSSIMDDSDAEQSAMDGNPSPRVIGSLVAAEVIQDMSTDGWNYKGLATPDNGTCTANCRPFTDSYGYVPKNNAWDLVDTTAWQPLVDSDGLGFFYAQEHVTPHIGFHAEPVILSRADLDAKKLDTPNYDYEYEIDMTLDRTANINEYQETMVRFMDNKINIAGGMIMRLRGKYSLSLEAQVFYHYGYTSSEHDVVLLAWKEKIRHDRVRPTSIIHHLRGDDEITSFGGTYKAKDWQPLIRVMPHSEYPSGSGCICIAVAQFIDEFLSDQYGDSSIETTWDFEDLGSVTFKNMMELADVCGESRLWGGMHFTPSVPDSYRLCDGVGTQGYTDLMKPLLGDGTYAELMDDSKEKYNEPSQVPSSFPSQVPSSEPSGGSPSGAPSQSPVADDDEDDVECFEKKNDKYFGGIKNGKDQKGTCASLGKKDNKKRRTFCKMTETATDGTKPAKDVCPVTCKMCDCGEVVDKKFFLEVNAEGEHEYRTCLWLQKHFKNKPKQAQKVCDMERPDFDIKFQMASDVCPVTCTSCPA